MDWLKKQNH
jgi:hypothetical protein